MYFIYIFVLYKNLSLFKLDYIKINIGVLNTINGININNYKAKKLIKLDYLIINIILINLLVKYLYYISFYLRD